MNATLLHGARIGDFCIIGASTLVGNAKEIPDYSLVVGVPGQNKGDTLRKSNCGDSGTPMTIIENSYAKSEKKHKQTDDYLLRSIQDLRPQGVP